MDGWTPDGDATFALAIAQVHRTLANDVARVPVGVLPDVRHPERSIGVVAAHLARVLPYTLNQRFRDPDLRGLFGPIAYGNDGYITACREFQLLEAASTRITFLTLPADRASMTDAQYRKAFQSRLVRAANPGLPPVELVDERYAHYSNVFGAALASGSALPWAWLVLSYLTGLRSDVNRTQLMDCLTRSLLVTVMVVAQELRARGVGPATIL